MLQVRILDDAEHGTARFTDGRDADAVADVAPGAVLDRPAGKRAQGLGGVGDAPVVTVPSDGVCVRVQCEFVYGDNEADVEVLAEVGFKPELSGVSDLARREIRCGVDDGAQTQKHDSSLFAGGTGSIAEGSDFGGAQLVERVSRQNLRPAPRFSRYSSRGRRRLARSSAKRW